MYRKGTKTLPPVNEIHRTEKINDYLQWKYIQGSWQTPCDPADRWNAEDVKKKVNKAYNSSVEISEVFVPLLETERTQVCHNRLRYDERLLAPAGNRNWAKQNSGIGNLSGCMGPTEIMVIFQILPNMSFISIPYTTPSALSAHGYG